MIPVKNQQISPKVVGHDTLDAGDSGTSGSGSIDVPADADAVVFLVAHWNTSPNFGFDSLSISGIEAETFMRIPQAVGSEYAMNVFGMRRPPTGTQTLSWTAGQSCLEAGRIYCVFLKDVIPHGQWIRDADGFHTDGGTERGPPYNLSSSPADIIVGTQGSFGTDLANPSFHNETLLYNNDTYNEVTSDVFHAKGAQLNTFNRTGGYGWDVYFAASVMGRHAQWLPDVTGEAGVLTWQVPWMNQPPADWPLR